MSSRADRFLSLGHSISAPAYPQDKAIDVNGDERFVPRRGDLDPQDVPKG